MPEALVLIPIWLVIKKPIGAIVNVGVDALDYYTDSSHTFNGHGADAGWDDGF